MSDHYKKAQFSFAAATGMAIGASFNGIMFSILNGAAAPLASASLAGTTVALTGLTVHFLGQGAQHLAQHIKPVEEENTSVKNTQSSGPAIAPQ